MSVGIRLDGFDEWERSYGQAAKDLKLQMAAQMRAMTGEFHSSVVKPIRDVTIQLHGGGTDRLGLSTAAVDDVEDDAYLHFDTSQDAASEPNMDGTGGGFHYAQMVLPSWWTDGPTRRVITAPSDGPFSTGKRAFAGPDFGPVRSFKQYEGDPYPLAADEDIKTATDLVRRKYSAQVLHEVFGL